jgi:hypothetical protein
MVPSGQSANVARYRARTEGEEGVAGIAPAEWTDAHFMVINDRPNTQAHWEASSMHRTVSFTPSNWLSWLARTPRVGSHSDVTVSRL